MANYAKALDRVRQQTEINYANREEGGGAIQGVFNGILNELNQDLDPNNVEKPLSPYGALLDSVVPFKQRQIEDAAKLQARLAQAVYTAREPLRIETRADELDAEIARRAAINSSDAQEILRQNLPTLPVDNESVKDFVINAVKEKSSLAKTIVQRDSKNRQRLLQIFEQDVQAPVEAGELIYTDENTGQQLYASSDSNAINLNYNHGRLGKIFRKNLEDAGFNPAEMRNLSLEARKKLFNNDKFKAVLGKTVQTVSPELLQSHSIYNKALDIRTKKINDVLKTRYTMIERDISKLEAARISADKEARRFSRVDEYQDIVDRIDVRLDNLREKRLRVELDGRFQDKIRAMVHRKAYAMSLLNKQKITEGSAEININMAIQLTMNDKELKDYKEQLEFYYNTAIGKVGTVSTTNTGATTTPTPLNKKPARLKAVAPSPKVVPNPAGRKIR